MRQYELMLVLHPEVDEVRLETVMDRVRRVVAQASGDVLNEESWGRRQLAFKMNRNGEANFHIVKLNMEPAAISELENTLNLADDVLRHMLVRQDDVPEVTPETVVEATP